MIVVCKSHPQLHVYDLGIRFVGGEAEVSVDTARTLSAMTGYSFEFSEEIPDPEELDAGTEPPAQEPAQEEPLVAPRPVRKKK